MDKNRPEQNTPAARGLLRRAALVLAALAGAFALGYEAAPPAAEAVAALAGGGLRPALGYLLRAVPEAGLAGSLAFAALAALYLRLFGPGRRAPRPALCALALLFAANVLTGLSMNEYGDLRLFTASWAQALVALAFLLGYGMLLLALLTLGLDAARRYAARPARAGSGRPRLERLAGAAGPWAPAAVILLLWLPYLLAWFPGSLSWDATNQLNMFFGVEHWYDNHPLLSTLVMGSCLWLGRALGSDDLGLFFYVLLQSLALALACGYSLRCMARWGVGLAGRGAALAFFALLPLWPFYAQWVVKDTLYIALALLFSCLVMEAALHGLRPGWRDPARLALAGLACCLLRQNGAGLALVSLALLPLALRGRAARLRCLAALGAAAAAFALWNATAVPALATTSSSRVELLVVPMQQTARYIREHGDALTDAQRQAIEGVLRDVPAETLGERYDPRLADPVKNLVVRNAGGAALAAYLRAWLSLLAAEPLTCLEATVANSYAYYCPGADREALLCFGTWIESDPAVDLGAFDLAYPAATAGLRAALYGLNAAVAKLPGLWLLYSQGAYTWLLLALAWLCCLEKRRRLLAGLAPALLTLLMCVFSSVNGEYRYFMPAIAAAPMLLAGTLCGLRERKELDT